jgi:telomerase Cajal body protein 1
MVDDQVSASSNSPVKLIAQSVDIHGDENFLHGCAFSPDGLCILTNTVADAQLRLYNTNIAPLPLPLPQHQQSFDAKSDSILRSKDEEFQVEELATTAAIQKWTTVLSSNGGDAVRCYKWYPLMTSSDPGTCCFLAASR